MFYLAQVPNLKLRPYQGPSSQKVAFGHHYKNSVDTTAFSIETFCRIHHVHLKNKNEY